MMNQKRFAVGDMVQIRANNRVDIANTELKTGAVPRGMAQLGICADKTCMV